AAYSSKGPTRYDLVIKPDLAAPGSHIVSAEAADSYLAKTYASRHVTGSGPNAYLQLSGTSMAAGVVSGAAALLLDARSSLKPSDIKAAFQVTSTFLPAAGLLGAGAGSVNVFGAAEFSQKGGSLGPTQIAGEVAAASGITFVGPKDSRLLRDSA